MSALRGSPGTTTTSRMRTESPIPASRAFSALDMMPSLAAGGSVGGDESSDGGAVESVVEQGFDTESIEHGDESSMVETAHTRKRNFADDLHSTCVFFFLASLDFSLFWRAIFVFLLGMWVSPSRDFNLAHLPRLSPYASRVQAKAWLVGR